jgi:hypothetical protein
MEHAVTAHADYIAKLKSVRSPILAIAELVWNAFDADAKRVDVILTQGKLGILDSIDIIDDGWGMSPAQATQAFSGLGGSWKRLANKTRHEQRVIHGKEGRGRFKALGLGRVAEWFVCYPDTEQTLAKFSVQIIDEKSDKFVISPDIPEPASQSDKRGVTVRLSEIHRPLLSLEKESVATELSQIFAIYLRRYREAALFYNNASINPGLMEANAESYPLPPVILKDGSKHCAEIEIVEWKVATERRLYLCDADGFPLDELSPGIQAPGFSFSAYLKSSAFEVLEREQGLGLGELDPTTRPVIEAAKNAMRDHFRRRAEEQAQGLIERWKEEEIYPYKEEPRSIAEEQERQVFNIAALNIATYLPRFHESEPKSKQLQLRLLRHAIETGPEEALRFLNEALELPQERRQQLAALLDRTTLSNMISATNTVTNRLEFLQGLRHLVFDADLKKLTKERSQLHRVVAPNAWLFGEQYNLSVDDQNLTAVLRKHQELLGDEVVIDDPVKRLDGTDGIIDLMFSRCIVQPGVAVREHLIVELKRPSVTIGTKEADQIESYATAIAEDEQFKHTKTNWIMWVVSTEIHQSVVRRASQHNRPFGILYQPNDLPITVWVKTWGQIIEEAAARLRFFEERLEYTPDRDASLAHLKKAYAQHVGELFAKPAKQEHSSNEELVSNPL